jgi:mRNA interferase HigB
MKVFNYRTIRDYADKHPQAAGGLEAWYAIASAALWHTPHAVKHSDPTVSLVGDRLVFNIQGNAFRLIARVDWQRQWLFIRFIGTHAAYDRINVLEV